MYKSVYQCRTTGKKVNVRRICSCDCIVHDTETGVEIKMAQTTMRKKYRFLKKESNPKRWESSNMFFSNKKAANA